MARPTYEQVYVAFGIPDGPSSPYTVPEGTEPPAWSPWDDTQRVKFEADDEIEAWDKFLVEWNEREDRLRARRQRG